MSNVGAHKKKKKKKLLAVLSIVSSGNLIYLFYLTILNIMSVCARHESKIFRDTYYFINLHCTQVKQVDKSNELQRG